MSALVVQVGEAFSAGRALVLFNDVWLPDDAIRELMGALPEKVSVLITTGAVLIPRTDPVHLDELEAGEARRLLLDSTFGHWMPRPGHKLR